MLSNTLKQIIIATVISATALPGLIRYNGEICK
jgi:hypothetical protein